MFFLLDVLHTHVSTAVMIIKLRDIIEVDECLDETLCYENHKTLDRSVSIFVCI